MIIRQNSTLKNLVNTLKYTKSLQSNLLWELLFQHSIVFCNIDHRICYWTDFVFSTETIFMSLFLAFIDCLLVMTTPLLIKFIISFASHEREDNTKGILLICGIIVSKIIMSILQTHASFGFVFFLLLKWISDFNMFLD